MESELPLFPDAHPMVADSADSSEVPRFETARRDLVQPIAYCLDDWVRADHPVRDVWALIERLDLSPLDDQLQAIDSNGGEDPIDPRILFALWVYATIEGIGSAREIERRTKNDRAFEWICGGVPVNYNDLSEFRRSVEDFDERLTNTIAALIHAGFVQLYRFADDDERTCRDGNSPTIDEAIAQAEQQVADLKNPEICAALIARKKPSSSATPQREP